MVNYNTFLEYMKKFELNFKDFEQIFKTQLKKFIENLKI